MIITHDGTWFVARTEYADRERCKAAGLLWDREARVWKTKFPARAAALRPWCDESALAALAEHQEKLAASWASDAEISVPAPAGLDYLGYQRAGIAYAASRRATLIADSMGLGKTIQALGVINLTPEIRRVLVVCPVSLKLNWQREAVKWLVRPARVEVANNGKASRVAHNYDSASAPSEMEMLVVNYEWAVRHAEELRRTDWDLVVLDEAHYTKNPESKRSQVAYDLAASARKLLLLTGALGI